MPPVLGFGKVVCKLHFHTHCCGRSAFCGGLVSMAWNWPSRRVFSCDIPWQRKSFIEARHIIHKFKKLLVNTKMIFMQLSATLSTFKPDSNNVTLPVPLKEEIVQLRIQVKQRSTSANYLGLLRLSWERLSNFEKKNFPSVQSNYECFSSGNINNIYTFRWSLNSTLIYSMKLKSEKAQTKRDLWERSGASVCNADRVNDSCAATLE